MVCPAKYRKVVNKNLNVFHLETAINNNMYDGQLSFISKNEDEYTEFGAKFVFEYNRGGTAWVSFAYEPGRREYKTYVQATQTDEISLFSNYTYNRVSLYTNFRLLDGLSFSGFLDFQPEDHERESDDATATLLSLSLIYMF